LNLTFEVREGIVKHSSDLEKSASGELNEYLPEFRPPLEAQLIDLCDEIAYNSADIDDASSAGLLDLAHLRSAAPAFNQICETVEMQYPGAPDRVKTDEVVRALVDWLVTSLIRGTAEAAEGIKNVDEVRVLPQRIARYSDEAALASAQLKQALRHEVYLSNLVTAERATSTAKIGRLFNALMERPDLMPEGYREGCSGWPLHRTVCDYIAGMTDGYLERSYELLFGKEGR
jgi:dGTPase